MAAVEAHHMARMSSGNAAVPPIVSPAIEESAVIHSFAAADGQLAKAAVATILALSWLRALV